MRVEISSPLRGEDEDNVAQGGGYSGPSPFRGGLLRPSSPPEGEDRGEGGHLCLMYYETVGTIAVMLALVPAWSETAPRPFRRIADKPQ